MTSYETKIIFSANIIRLMSKQGIKQVDLANHLNVSQSTVSSWVSAEKMPRMDKIERIADFLGVEAADLISKSSSIKNSSEKGTPSPEDRNLQEAIGLFQSLPLETQRMMLGILRTVAGEMQQDH